ncbi:MAG TPA: DNA polymerase III subunit alpha [Nocardioidaceae bacterium]|nr:DNA polymerase III subunit alpha [Nocardioidaceae bacterium]
MPGGDSFVHLHVHTEYSMLDGAARIGELLAECARLEMPALAITDHGYLFGAYEFYTSARAHGIKPIIGLEAYLTPGTSRFDRRRVRWGGGGDDDVSSGGAYTHLTLLAEDTRGMHNLFRLASKASLEGHFYKPRVDAELLSTYGAGLIATTGCAGGEVQTMLRLGRYAEAVEAAARYRDIFGPDNYFCEVMDHHIEVERRVREDLLRLARELALPLVATNDLHYTRREDAAAHAALLCVQTGSELANPKLAFEGDEFYLKSPAEMRAVWRELPEACDNTLLIAERCDVSFAEGANLMPRFPVPPGESEGSWFVTEVNRGLARRYPDGVSAQARERADGEVECILAMGFPGYFLVVADFITWAKAQGIRVGPGRGSVTGAIVAYALGITELDPLEHGLLFERFLNPERIEMPDIDIDFDERRRGEVIRYCTEKYGDDRVAQIVTFGTIKAKQAIKDSSRVLGFPFAMGERITKALPAAVMGKDISLAGIFDESHPRYGEAGEFRRLYDSDPEARRVVDTAKQLENLKRQWGVHAAGVIMSSQPLIDTLPLLRREQDGSIITQFDYPTCVTLGLLKMDFLGLRNLTVIDDAVANVERNRGQRVDVDGLGLDDPLTYALLSRGDTLGVFQLDGAPMRSLLRAMRPERFEDISAVLALYRPGPMAANAHIDYADRKNGRKRVEPIHPELAEPLAEILDETYGLIVYQEQVQAIARKVAGYTLGQADLLRRAMGKKSREILAHEVVRFSSGMRERGFSESAITKLWDTLLPFCDYGFNKSHTAGYGLVSYWTAYLKANFPAEYMAALLTSVHGDKDRSAIYLGECRRMGIKVLAPDVNESDADFTPVGSDIRFGLTAVRNVGANVVSAIVETRQQKGKFADFADFLAKVPTVVCNKRVVESLIKAGAFDSAAQRRRALVAVHEDAVDSHVEVKRNEAIGQESLFGDVDSDSAGFGAASVAVPDLAEWDRATLLAHEREMLGLYVSDHPLRGLEHALAAAADCSVGRLLTDEARPDGAPVTLAGLVTEVAHKRSKRGDLWASFTLEDLEGSIEVLVFSPHYHSAAALLAEDSIVLVKGRLQRRDAVPLVRAVEIASPVLSHERTGPVVITVSALRCTPALVESLKDVLGTHPGGSEVHLRLRAQSSTKVLRLDERLRVTPSPALMAELKTLLGPSCLAT